MPNYTNYNVEVPAGDKSVPLMIWLRDCERTLLTSHTNFVDTDLLVPAPFPFSKPLLEGENLRVIFTVMVYSLIDPTGKKFMLVKVESSYGKKALTRTYWVRQIRDRLFNERDLSYREYVKLKRIMNVAVRRRYKSVSRTKNTLVARKSVECFIEKDVYNHVVTAITENADTFLNQPFHTWELHKE